MVEELIANERGEYIDSMPALVGGLATMITLDDGVELWCPDEGLSGACRSIG